MLLRGPHDVMNLAALVGLSEERAKEAMTTNCDALLEHAAHRRTRGIEVRPAPTAASAVAPAPVGAASSSAGGGEESESPSYIGL